jgi:ankyrin repeat protein
VRISKLLVSVRRFPNLLHSQWKAEEDDDTALHNASINNHLEVVKFLLEQGADVNTIGMYPHRSSRSTSYISTVGDNNQTALHMASAYNHIEVVKFLVEKGADVNAISLCPHQSSGYTSLTSPLQAKMTKLL